MIYVSGNRPECTVPKVESKVDSEIALQRNEVVCIQTAVPAPSAPSFSSQETINVAANGQCHA